MTSAWPTVTLHDISRPTQWTTIPKSVMSESGYPVYGANGQIGHYDRYNHEHPTILIGCRGSCGSVHVSAPRSWVTGNAMALDDLDTERVDQTYLVHALRADGLQSAVTGTSQPQITRASLRRVQIPLPPLGEQLRLARILDATDAIRQKRRKVLDGMEAVAQAVFFDTFGDPASNPRRFPEMPLRAVAVRFSDGPFGSNLKSEHYVDSGVRVVRLQNIGVGKFVDLDRVFITPEHFKSLSKHYCRPGDVLVGTLGDPNLRACLQPLWLDRAVNKADCVQIRPNPSVANGEWVAALLNFPTTLGMAQSLVKGQTRSRISMGRLRDLVVPVPPLALQHEFAERISAVRRHHEILVGAEATLKELSASVQRRAFAGEL